MEQEKIPVQFIRCTEEQIQKMKAKFDEGTNINLNYDPSGLIGAEGTFINLNLEKEPEEDPIEKLIKELEEISI